LGQDGALNKLAQIKPLLLAIVDAVLALKCEEEMVKPKQDRDFARAEAGTMIAVVCSLAVYAGSPSAVGRTGRGTARRRGGARGEDALIRLQLPCNHAMKFAVASHRDVWSMGCEGTVLNNKTEVGQRALVTRAAQLIEGEILLLCEMTQGMDEQAENAPRNGRRGAVSGGERRLRHRGQGTFAYQNR